MCLGLNYTMLVLRWQWYVGVRSICVMCASYDVWVVCGVECYVCYVTPVVCACEHVSTYSNTGPYVQ